MPGRVLVLQSTEVILHWTVLDFNNAPKTGVTDPADVTLTLRRQSGSTMIAAAETVVWAEDGVTGHYYITFTPVNVGLYHLNLQETVQGSQLRDYLWDFNVQTAGAVFVPAFSECYCSEADVERWTQLDFSATSRPTSSQVAAFCEARAAEITDKAARNGVTITPSTITAGSVIEDLARELNAVGAGVDSFMSKFISVAPAQTDKTTLLREEWDRRCTAFIEHAWSLGAGGMATHISSGEVTLPSESNITDRGSSERITMDDLY